MIEVYKAKGELEAQPSKGMLDSYCIRSILRSISAGWVHSFVFDGMGVVKIIVPEAYAEEAEKIINSEYQSDSLKQQDED
jgi:hypothetical protein